MTQLPPNEQPNNEAAQDEQRPVAMPQMCDHHIGKTLNELKYKETDAWQACLIVAQIAMFQIATTKDSVWRRLQGDITKIDTLGCLACRLPSDFARLMTRAKQNFHDKLGAMKTYAEDQVTRAGGHICECSHNKLQHVLEIVDDGRVNEPTKEACVVCIDTDNKCYTFRRVPKPGARPPKSQDDQT